MTAKLIFNTPKIYYQTHVDLLFQSIQCCVTSPPLLSNYMLFLSTLTPYVVNSFAHYLTNKASVRSIYVHHEEFVSSQSLKTIGVHKQRKRSCMNCGLGEQ